MEMESGPRRFWKTRKDEDENNTRVRVFVPGRPNWNPGVTNPEPVPRTRSGNYSNALRTCLKLRKDRGF